MSKKNQPAIKGEAGFASLMPFGIGKTKPNHFAEMAGVVWENRDNLQYAWNILNHGVCDGCSLGPRGLEDDVIEGTHLCMSRLKLLRNNTVGPFSEADVADIESLRRMNNDELRKLGRVSFPMVYRPGDRGFSRISWGKALELVGGCSQETPPIVRRILPLQRESPTRHTIHLPRRLVSWEPTTLIFVRDCVMQLRLLGFLGPLVWVHPPSLSRI